MKNVDYGICDCCKKEKAIGVASVPYMPISIAWCSKCISADVIPYNLAVMNTAMINGLDKSNEGWKDLVNRVLKYFNISEETFKKDVEVEINKFNESD